MTDLVDERENLLLNTGNLTNKRIEISVTDCTLSLSYKITSHCVCFNFLLKEIAMLQEHFKVADHYGISDSKNGRYFEVFLYLVTGDWKRGKRETRRIMGRETEHHSASLHSFPISFVPK